MQAAPAPDELVPCPIEDFSAAIDALPSACCTVASAHLGERRGWTVTAQATVPVGTPSIMVCVKQSASVHRLILAPRRLNINQLLADQTDKPRLFASATGVTEDQEFGGGRRLTLKTGAPILADAVNAYDCLVVESTRMETHSVFLAIVVAVRFRSSAPAVDSLVRPVQWSDTALKARQDWSAGICCEEACYG